MTKKIEIDSSKLKTTAYAKPFLKWLGGKTQLLEELETRVPESFDGSWTYVEPFLGGGALMFHLMRKFPGLKAVANDLNPKLMNTYEAVKSKLPELLRELKGLETEYLRRDEARRASYFYSKREEFNTISAYGIRGAALMIFLNKTCFNGLYRENSSGEFNSPHGKYANPTICNEDVLKECSEVLQRCELTCLDYKDMLEYAGDKTLWYFDPPYRPLTKTSAFTAYTKSGFNDDNQKELKEFCDKIGLAGSSVMLSDSDTGDGFFDELYSGYEIDRVSAVRSVNCKGDKRGPVSELIITNF